MRYPRETSSGRQAEPVSSDRFDPNELIVSHLSIVKRMAFRLSKTLPACVSMDDLIAAGMLGLTRAAHKWRPERGVKFSYYCRLRIRGQMLDELRSQDHIKRRAQQASKGRQFPGLVPLNIDAPAKPIDITRNLCKHEFPSGLLAMLNCQERVVLDLHYIGEQTLASIAGHFGVSATRVAQIHRSLKSKARTWYVAAGVA